jgi:hypothetical protein
MAVNHIPIHIHSFLVLELFEIEKGLKETLP